MATGQPCPRREGVAIDFNFHELTTAQADFMNCLLAGLLGALPSFLQAFMACLGGNGSSGSYDPGSRKRC